jgi:O-antigen/teichoic acid export membrane protein/glycosyltransferase involved in cell wall biosynthesis
LRVTHTPVNIAGVPWENVQALRRSGVDARLVVVNRGRLHPEADWSLDRHGALPHRLLTQFGALARLLPATDIFHFYFGLTLVPKSVQFPILRATGKRSVYHYLGSDIRGKKPEELAYGKRADAEIVGSYAALRWVPEARVVPPGLDLSQFVPQPPSNSRRPRVVHAPSNRDKKGTQYIIEACANLPVELEIVEGVPHDIARERYARADIVVDQLNAGWHGVFALEAMALGKPVVAYLDEEAVERSAEAFGLRLPIIPTTKQTVADSLRPLIESPALRREIGEESRHYVEQVHDIGVIAERLRDIYREISPVARAADEASAEALPAPRPPRRLTVRSRPTAAGDAAPVRMNLASELWRLMRHTAVYGIGGLVSAILAVILLPLFTHYLPTDAYGKVEIVTAFTSVMSIVLQLGISSAFFRFYFDSKDPVRRGVVVRTSFWFVMTMATLGLVLGLVFAGPLSVWIGLGHDPSLARAGAVGLWAATNYQMITSLFRVEERSLAYAIASVSNVLITIAAMVIFVAVFRWGAIGLVVGNFVGTLCVYGALVAYRREQLHFEFDRALFRSMQKFGMPLVPAALALWAINFIDREFVSYYKGDGEVGIYSVAIKIGSVVTFVVLAFRTAWPAFAYSIEDDRAARRAYAYVLTYVLVIASWISLALGALAPWVVQWLTSSTYHRAEKGVALLAFAFAIFAGYTVLAIGSGRARRTQMNWVVTGIGAFVNVGLNFWLIPRYGMVGASISTCAAYTILFAGMALYAQSVYPVDYQWRRCSTAVATAVALSVAARAADLSLVPSALIALAYPLALFPLGFYLPAELGRLRRFATSAVGAG